MTIAEKRNNNDIDNQVETEDHTLDQWYKNLKEQSNLAANKWLHNMRIVDELTRKTPNEIAEMKPEEAHDLVLKMVKDMQSDRMRPSDFDIMANSSDWPKYNDSNKPLDNQVLNESISPLTHMPSTLLQENEFFENKSKTTIDLGIYQKGLLSLLIEKSDLLLKADGNDFVIEMRNLERILAEFDPARDSMISSIDKSINKGVEMDLGLYYFAAYSCTKDFAKALKVHLSTNSLIRYVALLDRFHESRDQGSLSKANSTLEELIAISGKHIGYYIKLAIERLWPFWKFEQVINERISCRDTFSDKELRYFILFKSSDTPMLYCAVLDSHIESFNPNIATVFHYNQALIDILDDYFDIEEDFLDNMPNIFLMASSGHFSFPIPDEESDNLLNAILVKETKCRVNFIVNWLSDRLSEIVVPVEYAFLKDVAHGHVQQLRSILM